MKSSRPIVRLFVAWSTVLAALLLSACGGGGGDAGAPLTPPPATFTLAVTLSGNGSVASAPAGIQCGATCSAAFTNGASVTLTATSASGATFAGWSGGGCSGQGTCVVTLSAAQNVTATFTATTAATRFVFASNVDVVSNPGGITAFSLDASGRLTLRANYPVTAAVAPTLDPSGTHLYVLSNAGGVDVLAYSIAPTTGALTPVAGSPFAVGTTGDGASISIDPDGQRLRVVRTLGTVSSFVIAPTTGALSAQADTPVSNGSAGTDSNLLWSTFDPTGSFLYLADEFNAPVFAVAASGALSPAPGSPFPIVANNYETTAVAADPAGGFVYFLGVPAGTQTGSIVGFAANATSGVLTPISATAPVIGFPQEVGPELAIDPTGRFLYAAGGGTVAAFSIAPSSGALSAIGAPFTTGVNAFSLAVDSAGKLLFAGGQGSVSVLAIDSVTGAPTPVAGSPFATVGANAAVPRPVNGVAVTH